MLARSEHRLGKVAEDEAGVVVDTRKHHVRAPVENDDLRKRVVERILATGEGGLTERRFVQEPP